MKRLFVTVFAICSIATVSQAQPPNTVAPQSKTAKKEMKEAQWNELCKKAGLDEGEIAKTKVIRDDSYKQQKALKADTKLTADELKAKKKLLHDDIDAKYKAALGDVKYKAFKKALNESNKNNKAQKAL